MQHYTVYFTWKLPYMFRVVPSHIIRSANNCIYSIWYLSHRYCYLPLSSTTAADSNNGMTNTRYCRYSCFCSWWWVMVPPETCRAVSRQNKLCILLDIYILEFSYLHLPLCMKINSNQKSRVLVKCNTKREVGRSTLYVSTALLLFLMQFIALCRDIPVFLNVLPSNITTMYCCNQ